ncbi:hypothetical protein EVAR_68472_1 [Eumeta japonica]|uniref:Uncharacterized protein n=1 Tax=Eumeta variegata TaxID=151549 RepID=A0A4C2A4W3_EUMVA|nr:hypothetical protein EVAR_68472_1 [Eumeta japonica]
MTIKGRLQRPVGDESVRSVSSATVLGVRVIPLLPGSTDELQADWIDSDYQTFQILTGHGCFRKPVGTSCGPGLLHGLVGSWVNFGRLKKFTNE